MNIRRNLSGFMFLHLVRGVKPSIQKNNTLLVNKHMKITSLIEKTEPIIGLMKRETDCWTYVLKLRD